MSISYLFTSPRLGFRLWQESDLPQFAEMNADEETMRFFDKPLSQEESKAMMDRMNQTYADRGFCYFAVDLLETGEFIGMIGLGWKTFDADFTPCVDIGWRLDKRFWNRGYASEGAERCLEFGESIGVKTIYSLATASNLASIRVMQKIGLSYLKDFDLPDLVRSEELNPCALYYIKFA
ncbi:GNAT family N-acetyltransferase [Algoriphagus namhaensis]|uniref:GNAT family N-acetyltransferase n=1 Tax=Algoriphagus namhaensis TaxID=915353 RepID=A0ABV8AR99_9BACT